MNMQFLMQKVYHHCQIIQNPAGWAGSRALFHYFATGADLVEVGNKD